MADKLAERGEMYLALLDVDQVHGYVFATHRLREIRGASALLADIDRRIADECSAYTPARGQGLLSSAAGVAKAIFRDKGDASEFCRRWKSVYESEADGLTVTTHVEPLSPAELGSAFGTAMMRAERALRARKDHPEHAALPVTHPLFLPCQLCGVRPAEVPYGAPGTGETELLCPGCAKKARHLRRVRELPIETKIRETLATKLTVGADALEFPSTLHGVAAATAGDDESPDAGDGLYLGFLYADGNGVGELLGAVSAVESFMALATSITKELEDGLCGAAAEVLPALRRPGWLDGAEGAAPRVIPLRVLLFGGDDLVLVAPASAILAIVEALLGRMATISMSAAVVIAKPKFPIRQFLSVGDALLRSAKQHHRAHRGAMLSTVDFTVISSSVARDPIELRASELSDGSALATARPYVVGGAGSRNLGSLLSAAQDLEDAMKRGVIARSKLKALRSLLVPPISKPEIGRRMHVWFDRLHITDGAREVFATAGARFGLSAPKVFLEVAAGPITHIAPIWDVLEILDVLAGSSPRRSAPTP